METVLVTTVTCTFKGYEMAPGSSSATVAMEVEGAYGRAQLYRLEFDVMTRSFRAGVLDHLDPMAAARLRVCAKLVADKIAYLQRVAEEAAAG